MAAAQELSFDDICTCSICLETFKIPKYLPCLHSFCETCLDTYIQSSIYKKETAPSTGFQCPVCRTLVSLGDSAGSPNSWAKQMPVNHLIMSMMDRRAIEKSEKFCDSCILNNTKEIACSWCVVCQEAFCATCEKYHRNFKMSSSHKIIEIKDRNLDLTDMFLSGTTVQCDQHKEKAIEVYCVDHAKPCCTLCATVNHRRCEKVVAIDEVVSSFKNSTQAKAISNILDEMSSKLEEIVQKRKENILQIEGQNDNILQSAVKLKDSVIKHLEKLDQTFRTELECATKQVLLPLKDDATVLSSYKCTIDNWRTILRSCLSYGSEIQYFVEANKIDYKQKQLDQDIRDLLSKMSTASLKFTPNLTLVEHQTGLTSLGKLEIDTVRFRQEGFLPKVNLKEGNIKIIQTIETGSSYTSGIFLCDFIILTDSVNTRVLKYDDKGVLLKSLSLDGGPNDVTRIDQDIVAVNEGYKCIVIIRVTDMVIQRKLDRTTFNTELVYGFQYVNNCFVCAYNNQITWINASTGAIVNTRKTEGETWYLHASENQELIFTDGKKISKLFNGQLKLFYESKEIINPRGIDVDFEGNVYVCGFSSNNIHQLTREGKLIRIIPAATLGLINPWVLRFMENGNRFLLSQSTGGKVLICEIV